MDDVERMKAEAERLDALVQKASNDDKRKGALAIRNELRRRGEKLSAEDEKVLDAFAKGEVSLTLLANQFQGRI